jgi:hypothetical protein
MNQTLETTVVEKNDGINAEPISNENGSKKKYIVASAKDHTEIVEILKGPNPYHVEVRTYNECIIPGDKPFPCVGIKWAQSDWELTLPQINLFSAVSIENGSVNLEGWKDGNQLFRAQLNEPDGHDVFLNEVIEQVEDMVEKVFGDEKGDAIDDIIIVRVPSEHSGKGVYLTADGDNVYLKFELNGKTMIIETFNNELELLSFSHAIWSGREIVFAD